MITRALASLHSEWRIATRSLLRAPGVSAIVVLTLAVSIGPLATLLSVFSALAPRTLHAPEPRQLFFVESPTRGGRAEGTSYPGFVDYRSALSPVASLSASLPFTTVDSAAGGTLLGEAVTSDYFAALGVRPERGRFFLPDEDRVDDRRPVAVISHALWVTRFGGRPDALGRRLRIGGAELTIVGVAPEGFGGLRVRRSAAVFIPLGTAEDVVPGAAAFAYRDAHFLDVFGRMRGGSSLPTVQARLAAARQVELATFPSTAGRASVRAVPLLQHLQDVADRAGLPTALNWALGLLASAVLLVGCANVATILLARALANRHQLAISLALGATHARVARVVVYEGLLLSAAGVAAAALLAVVGLDVATSLGLMPADVRGHGWGYFAPLAAVAVATGVLSTSAPALLALRQNIALLMKRTANLGLRAGESVGLRRLVIAQFALSVLLSGLAAQFARSVTNLRALDPGFETAHLLAARVSLPLAATKDGRRVASYETLTSAAMTVAGVRATGIGIIPLLTNASPVTTPIAIAGSADTVRVNADLVGPGYFEAVGIPLRAGRLFNLSDRLGAPRVAVISERLAARLWPRQDPLGRVLSEFGYVGQHGPRELVVVGVVRDIIADDVRNGREPRIYRSILQSSLTGAILYARVDGPPAAAVPRLREALSRAGVGDAERLTMVTVDALREESLSLNRAAVAASAMLGGIAFLLGASGLYGVLSYVVARRSSEIGLRLALGASRSAVLRLVLDDAGRIAASGLVVGVAITAIVSRGLRSLLYDVPAIDPLVVLSSAGILSVAMLVGAIVPAARALRASPMKSLRAE